jgi:hypothetical protein
MQDTKDPRAFTIVERYAHESVSLLHPPSHLHSIAASLEIPTLIISLTKTTESKVPPREPILADFRQVRYPLVGQGHGPPSLERARRREV